MGSRPSKERRGSGSHATFLGPEETAEPVVLDSGRYVVVALYDYPSGGPAECCVRVGERLGVLSDEGEWWRVKSSSTGKESYIPSNYTTKVYNRWQYESISREKAEELLRLPYNQTGSFLIRESQTHLGSHSLSVRKSSSTDQCNIRHYRIHQLENGWHFITPRLTFPTLASLVEHYTETKDGLCCLLREPCFIQGSNNVPVITGPPPMAIRKPTLNWKDVNSTMIFGPSKADLEDSLVSEGLREAINSYLYMTEECGECLESWET
ncbi:src-like-adapter 2 [Denticeps clupeoides]|uniref:Src-like-adapter 2 n=1 Tax=Denticeps clupeoides TaxID=299321 RepID=A0AAY4CE83_9TELE|nr:src-like-adapter 2 [Denticeps clupeoides]